MPEKYKGKEPKRPSGEVPEIVVVIRKPREPNKQMKMTKCHVRIEKSGKNLSSG